METQVTYVGHVMDKTGIHPVPEKVRAIAEAPSPTGKKEIKSYLGMLNYNNRFLPNLSTLLAPLHKLLKDAEELKWGPEQKRAFDESKLLLQSSQVLVHYDPNREIVMNCDASPYGVAAVLAHTMKDGSERPIRFVSRTLAPAEKNYSQLEKEALAIIFGVKKFHQYIVGRSVRIRTDHKPLTGLFGSQKGVPVMAAARIQRWALLLAGYEYTLEYRSGASNGDADALSRLPLPTAPEKVPLPSETVLLMEHLGPVTSTQIKQWTRQDPVLSQILTFVLTGWPSECHKEDWKPYFRLKAELTVLDGCLLWGNRVIIPRKGEDAALTELHAGHQGITRMKSLARSYMWWSGMDAKIEREVQGCSPCQSVRHMPAKAPLHPWEWPKKPWSRLHADYAGPFMGSMFLVVVDAHSKWIEVVQVAHATSVATVEKMRLKFSTHGLPETVVTDNGSCFTSEEFRNFLRGNGIRHVTSAPYHPASNGLAERAEQTFKGGMKKQQEGSLQQKLMRFLFQYRITPQTTTGTAPAELLLGRRPRSGLDLMVPSVESKVHRAQGAQKDNHDQAAQLRTYETGGKVYLRNYAAGDVWVPGFIHSKTGPVSYTAQTEEGALLRKHQDQIWPRWSAEGQQGKEQDRGGADSSVIEVPRVVPELVSTGSMEVGDTEADVTVQTPESGPRASGRMRRVPEKFKDYVM